MRVYGVVRTTKELETRYLPTGTCVVNFSVAYNTATKTEKKTYFYDCKAFGKLAENMSKYVGKGKELFIEGDLVQETWQDKNSGNNRSKLTVTVTNCKFLSGDKQQGASYDQVKNASNNQPGQPLKVNQVSDKEFFDDECPF